jgi:membrane protein DedA with SNARE-associated domain
MIDFHLYLNTAMGLVSEHRYLVLFLLGLLEGGNSTVVAGVFVATGDLQFWPAFLLLTLGETLNGSAWFYAGSLFGSKFVDRMVGRLGAHRIADLLRRGFRASGMLIIFVAKMTFSLTNLTLLVAGSLKFDQRRFHAANIVGSIGWVSLLMAIGMFFGVGSQEVVGYMRAASFYVIVIIGALVAAYLLARASRHVLSDTLHATTPDDEPHKD